MSKESHSFSPSVAEVVGVNCALILQHLMFLQKDNLKNGQDWKKVWVTRSAKALTTTYSYLSAKEIRGALDRLEGGEYIFSKIDNKTPGDRSKSFILTQIGLDLMGIPFDKRENGHLTKSQMSFDKRANDIKDSYTSYTHTNRGGVSEKETPSTPPDSDSVSDPDIPALDSETDTVRGATTKPDYPADFLDFWKQYAHPAGSKKTAASRWAHLTEKLKALAMAHLTAHVRATTTDKAKGGAGSVFKPFRCAAEVYLSERRWEAYAEIEARSNPIGDSDQYSEWSEMYDQYLRSCKAYWPEVLADCAHLSKKEFAIFKGGNYMKGIGRLDEKMQGDRLKKCHTAYNDRTPSAVKCGTVWSYYLDYIEKHMVELFTV